MTEAQETPVWRRALLLASEVVIVIYVILDFLITPAFLPLIRWTAKLRLVTRLQNIVASLPPYGVLAALSVPFFGAEPAKIYGLILIGTGRHFSGLVILVLAYVVSLIVVDRIYQAGKAKLRQIAWFARLLDWLLDFRDDIFRWAKSTRAWAFAMRAGQRARAIISEIRLRFDPS